MRKLGRNKPDHTGRSKYFRYASLAHSLMDTRAYRSLTPNARSLLLELVRRHNGDNNGQLWLSVRDAADLMGVVDTKATMAAFSELQKRGFIAMTREAYFEVRASDTSRARCWRMTFLSVPSVSKPATHDYRDANIPPGKPEKRAARGMAAIARYKNDHAENRMPVVENDTLLAQFEGNWPNGVANSPTSITQNSHFQRR